MDAKNAIIAHEGSEAIDDDLDTALRSTAIASVAAWDTLLATTAISPTTETGLMARFELKDTTDSRGAEPLSIAFHNDDNHHATYTMSDFPGELLEMALKELGRLSSLTNSLRICKSWRTIDQYVLWTDIAINNLEDVIEFSENDSHTLLLTCTLTVAFPAFMPDHVTGYEHKEELRSTKRLLARIVDGLPKQSRKMEELESLSLSTVPNCPRGFS
jgi:hypothetical protein